MLSPALSQDVLHLLASGESFAIAMIVDHQGARHQRANKINAVDTTAAGDTFIGGLATGLVEGMILDQAVWLGQQASALCVQRHGAQPSIPYRHEIA